jgi:hypothetical protein
LKKILPALALLAAAALLNAQPAATLGQLKARQLKERQELQADQKRRSDQLKKTMAEDQELFQHRRKQLRQESKAALMAEKRTSKTAESKAQCKQKQAEFKRSAARERERFYHDLQAKVDFLEEVQAKETRQLEDKQRSELAHFQP